MLRTMRIVGLLCAIGVATVSVTGCDALGDASDNLGKAKVCTEALAAAGYTPDWSNPDKSANEAADRADKLRDLADSTADANLQRELRDMANQMDNVSAEGAAEWTKRKAEELDDLRKACT